MGGGTNKITLNCTPGFTQCLLCRKFAENVGIAHKTPEEVFGCANLHLLVIAT